MNNKVKNIVLSIIFITFLFTFMIVNIVKKDDDISYSERRKLEKVPKITYDSVINGTYFSKLDKYTTDQFIWRDNFRKIKIDIDLLTKNNYNKLYLYNDYIIENLQGLDALLLEANHDIRMLQVGKYPYYLKQRILGDRGHLSNENAGRLLCRLLHDNLKAIFLGHLSRENNYEELAYETVCSEVTLGDNPYKSKDFRIQVAKRDFVSDVVTV